MRATTLFRTTLLAMLFTVSGCNVYNEIAVSSDPVADLSRYRSFAWLPDVADTATSPYNNEIIRNNLKNYFGQCFAERGYAVNLDSPDVLLQVIIVNSPKVLRVPRPVRFYYRRYYYKSDYYFPYSFDYYYHGYGTYCPPSGDCTMKINYVEGSITLKVIDRKLNKAVWSCTARGDIYDPAFINRSIHPAVISIMKRFPVKPVEYRKRSGAYDDVFSYSR